MSEKCPICNENAYINGPLFMCRECPFVANYIDLPRISAAMELAKWMIALLHTSSEDPRCADVAEKYSDAEQRVIEVFNA